MIYIIYLIYGVLAAQSGRSTNIGVKRINESIRDASYMANINQSIIFQYTNYFGTFNMSLFKQQQGNSIQIVKNESFNPELIQGCQPYNRQIIQKQLYSTAALLEGETIDTMKGIITAVYAANSIIYALRSDFKIFVYTIDYDIPSKTILDVVKSEVIDFSAKLGITEDSPLIEDSQLQCSQYLKSTGVITCYILTQYGTLQFAYDQQGHKLVLLNKLEQLRNQQIIHTFLDDSNQLLLITYASVTDVYLVVPDGSLTLKQTIFPHKEANLLQAKVDENGEKIYILDEISGIYIYNIDKTTLKISEYPMYIYLKSGQTFDFVGSTFFVVALTQEQFPYVLEIFVNFIEQSYYFNGVYQYDEDIFDVFVGKTFTLFVRNQLHQLNFHSIYNGFHNQNTEQFYFYDLDLVQVDELYPPWLPQQYKIKAIDEGLFSTTNLTYNQTFLVGISEKEISLFTIKEVPPWVFCTALEETKEYYELVLLSSNCQGKSTSQNFQDQFVECTIRANFTFEGLPVYFYEQDYKLLMAVAIGLIVITIILGILVLLCRNKWYQKLNDLNEESIRNFGIRADEKELDTENIQTIF